VQETRFAASCLRFLRFLQWERSIENEAAKEEKINNMPICEFNANLQIANSQFVD
jgi:hypothetical protein